MSLQGQSVATDYLRDANNGTLTLAMIETPQALANVDAIAATPGIDALFIGPYDLSTSLSAGKAQDINAPEVDKAIDKICAAAIKAGKIPGIYCRDAERALAMTKRGFKFLTVGSDQAWCARAGGELKALDVVRSNTKDALSFKPTSRRAKPVQHRLRIRLDILGLDLDHLVFVLVSQVRLIGAHANGARLLPPAAPGRSRSAARTTRNRRRAAQPAPDA